MSNVSLGHPKSANGGGVELQKRGVREEGWSCRRGVLGRRGGAAEEGC